MDFQFGSHYYLVLPLLLLTAFSTLCCSWDGEKLDGVSLCSWVERHTKHQHIHVDSLKKMANAFVVRLSRANWRRWVVTPGGQMCNALFGLQSAAIQTCIFGRSIDASTEIIDRNDFFEANLDEKNCVEGNLDEKNFFQANLIELKHFARQFE